MSMPKPLWRRLRTLYSRTYVYRYVSTLRKPFQTTTTTDGSYAYRSLQPSRATRVLRLLPSKDASATLRGQLFEYSLEDMYADLGSYDALSYVWGDPKTSEAIAIDGRELPITANLHVALVRLRHSHVERLLWVDQLCIDQSNDKEKEDQIKLMSQIYACASCVIVWLGEATDDSDCAMKELQTAGRERSADPIMKHEMWSWIGLGYVHSWASKYIKLKQERPVSNSVTHLFQRPWFRRIWVLQEVGVARRVQIRCGRSVIDGHALALAADVLKPTSETWSEEQALHNRVQSAAFLIKQSTFRPLYHGPRIPTGGICNFGELVDMIHSREATKSHDKIYALLGMSSTDMDGSGLLPDYAVPFGELFERLIKFTISDRLTVECQNDKEAAVFKGRGHVLGTIKEVKNGIVNENEKRIEVHWGQAVVVPNAKFGGTNDLWDLRIPAIHLCEGDIIILLEGAASPSIVRVHEDFLVVIVAVATLRSAGHHDRPKLIPTEDSAQVRVPKRNFVLVWDWNYSPESYQHLGRYAMWAKSKGWTSTDSNLIAANRLDDLTRFWECSIMRWEGDDFRYMEETFKMCLCECEEVLQIEELRTKGREQIIALIHGMIGESFTTSDSISWQHVSFQEILATSFVTYLFHRAIRECHNEVIDVLIGTGHVRYDLRFEDDHDNILYGIARRMLSSDVVGGPQEKPHSTTLLQAAAWDYYLQERGQVLARNQGSIPGSDRFSGYGTTALQAAAEAGSFAVVERLLLEMWADVNAPADEDGGMTALQAAAKTGNMAIVDKLLRHDADVNAQGAERGGRTALQAASEAGQMAIVQQLVQHHADINAPATASYGRTALQGAAGAGHLDIVQWLLELRSNINAPAARYYGRTALQAAAEAGHLQIVELLLEHKADVNAPAAHSGKTALQAAAGAGHLQIVELLLEHKADANAPAANCEETALQAAAGAGHLQIVKLLLEHKADVNAPAADDWGKTALQSAVRAGHLQIVEYLLKHKADVNAPPTTSSGRTALGAAAEAGHLQIVECLLEHKADVNAPISLYDGGNNTALKAAAERGHLAIVERLKQAGAWTF